MNSHSSTTPARIFQTWEFRVSHGMLLIRSPRDEMHPENCDFVFSGVEYVALPRHVGEVQLSECLDQSIVASVEAIVGKRIEQPYRLYSLRHASDDLLVMAAGVRINNNTLDIFDSSWDRS